MHKFLNSVIYNWYLLVLVTWAALAKKNTTSTTAAPQPKPAPKKVSLYCFLYCYFNGRKFHWKKFLRFRGFLPNSRKFIPRNLSKSFICESLFPRIIKQIRWTVKVNSREMVLKLVGEPIRETLFRETFFL